VDTLTLCEVSSYGINIRENIKLFDFYWIGMGDATKEKQIIC